MPQTRFAPQGEGFIAYQTLGEGPPDIVFVRSAWNHIEVQWEDQRFARFLTRLGSIGRLIMFDPMGCGLSDAFFDGNVPLYEEWADDILAVMDAVGSERAAVVCSGFGTIRGAVFSAVHPERVSSLVIMNGYARFLRDDDYPYGRSEEENATSIDEVVGRWGIEPSPLVADIDPAFAAWLTRYVRYSAAPGFYRRVVKSHSAPADIRSVLPAIRVPTLVIQHRESLVPISGIGPGRYIADRIEGAGYVELPGLPIWEWRYPDPDAVADEIERFLLGRPSAPDPDRVLATVLFTDIVESTRSTAAAGDRRWLETMDALDRLVDVEVGRFRGRIIKSTGDGHLATFDGPGRAIRCASSITEQVGRLGIVLRSGLHTGEVEVRGDDIGGIAVNIARRVCDVATDGSVFVSSTVPPLVAGSQIAFSECGTHELKGVPGTWQLFQVKS